MNTLKVTSIQGATSHFTIKRKKGELIGNYTVSTESLPREIVHYIKKYDCTVLWDHAKPEHRALAARVSELMEDNK